MQEPIDFIDIDLELADYDRWEDPYQVFYYKKGPRWGQPEYTYQDYCVLKHHMVIDADPFITYDAIKENVVDVSSFVTGVKETLAQKEAAEKNIHLWQPQKNYGTIIVAKSSFVFSADDFRNASLPVSFSDEWPERQIADAYLMQELHEKIKKWDFLKQGIYGQSNMNQTGPQLKKNLDDIVAETGSDAPVCLKKSITHQVENRISAGGLLKELDRSAYEGWKQQKQASEHARINHPYYYG